MRVADHELRRLDAPSLNIGYSYDHWPVTACSKINVCFELLIRHPSYKKGPSISKGHFCHDLCFLSSMVCPSSFGSVKHFREFSWHEDDHPTADRPLNCYGIRSRPLSKAACCCNA